MKVGSGIAKPNKIRIYYTDRRLCSDYRVCPARLGWEQSSSEMVAILQSGSRALLALLSLALLAPPATMQFRSLPVPVQAPVTPHLLDLSRSPGRSSETDPVTTC